MNTQFLLLSSTFLFSQVHSFATTGVCLCLQFLMITQAPDRNSISLDVFLYNLTRAEAWIMASGNHNIVFPSSPSSPRRNFIAAVHYPPFSSSSHSSHDNLPIASFWVVAWFTFLIIASSTCSFLGADVEASSASSQSPCCSDPVKDLCAAGTIGGVGASVVLEASLALRSVCHQSEPQRLISARC